MSGYKDQDRQEGGGAMTDTEKRDIGKRDTQKRAAGQRDSGKKITGSAQARRSGILFGAAKPGSFFVLLVVLAVLRGILHYGEQYCNHFIAFRLLAIIRHRVFAVLRRLCPAKLETQDKGNLISILTSDIELMEGKRGAGAVPSGRKAPGGGSIPKRAGCLSRSICGTCELLLPGRTDFKGLFPPDTKKPGGGDSRGKRLRKVHAFKTFHTVLGCAGGTGGSITKGCETDQYRESEGYAVLCGPGDLSVSRFYCQ